MNSVIDVMPMNSTVSRGAILNKLFLMGYLTAIIGATVGWVSAFGWITVTIAKWLMA